jgi:type I restriction enzyme S subunit
MHLTPKELALVRDIVKQQVPEYGVIAFGSRVHGKNLKKFSDLDLAIQSSTPLPTGKLASVKNAFSESDLPFKVDVIDWAGTDEKFRRIISAASAVIQPAPQ